MQNRSFILICCLLLVVQLYGADKDRLTFYYNIAEGNYLIGDQSGAERGLEQSLRLDPNHAPSLALKAKIHLDQSRPQKALLAAEQAVKSAPNELEYQLLKALILGKLDQRAKAIALIDDILKKAKPSSEHALTAQHLRGLLNMADERWDEAAAAFERSYEFDPNTSDGGRQLASEAYLEKARRAPDINQALAAVDQAIELYSDATGRENLQSLDRLKLTRVKLLVQAGQTKAAIDALQQQVGQNPDDLEATVTLASLYADREEWRALEDLIAPIAQSPLLADVALYLEGRVALSRDRVGTARAKFEEALKLNADRPTALQHTLQFYRSICLERLKRYDKAGQSLRKAIDGGYVPETSTETVHLGRLLMRRGEIDKLIPVLEKALLRGNGNAEAWAILGRAHLEKKQNMLAVSALNQSLTLEPRQSETLALRGSLLRKIGDLEGALADYKSAHSLVPSSPVISYERGLVLLQLGSVVEAEPFLRHAAQKLSTNVTVDLLHASCAYALGKYDQSAQSLREYLDPRLDGAALERFKANLSETASYLHTLLANQAGLELPALPATSKAARLFKQYTTGQASRKEVLDWAGRAETHVLARSQISSAAYWLAQFEHQVGNFAQARELLKITLDTGSSENPEWQFANWQIKQTKY